MKTLVDLVCRAQAIHELEIRHKNEQFAKYISEINLWYPQGLEVYEQCADLLMPWNPWYMCSYAYFTVTRGEQQEKLVEIRRRLSCTFEEYNVLPKHSYVKKEDFDEMSDEDRQAVIVTLTPSTHLMVKISYERQLHASDRCRVNDEVQKQAPTYVDRQVLCKK